MELRKTCPMKTWNYQFKMVTIFFFFLATKFFLNAKLVLEVFFF